MIGDDTDVWDAPLPAHRKAMTKEERRSIAKRVSITKPRLDLLLLHAQGHQPIIVRDRAVYLHQIALVNGGYLRFGAGIPPKYTLLTERGQILVTSVLGLMAEKLPKDEP